VLLQDSTAFVGSTHHLVSPQDHTSCVMVLVFGSRAFMRKLLPNFTFDLLSHLTQLSSPVAPPHHIHPSASLLVYFVLCSHSYFSSLCLFPSYHSNPSYPIQLLLPPSLVASHSLTITLLHTQPPSSSILISPLISSPHSFACHLSSHFSHVLSSPSRSRYPPSHSHLAFPLLSLVLQFAPHTHVFPYPLPALTTPPFPSLLSPHFPSPPPSSTLSPSSPPLQNTSPNPLSFTSTLHAPTRLPPPLPASHLSSLIRLRFALVAPSPTQFWDLSSISNRHSLSPCVASVPFVRSVKAPLRSRLYYHCVKIVVSSQVKEQQAGSFPLSTSPSLIPRLVRETSRCSLDAQWPLRGTPLWSFL